MKNSKKILTSLLKSNGFFQDNYQTPQWLAKKISRRTALKSAAGVTTLASVHSLVTQAHSVALTTALAHDIQTDPWLTLDAVFMHLLPESSSGPSAKDIQASNYLYHVVHQQPTEQVEIDFIYQGVTWLNDYSLSQTGQKFIAISQQEKETLLREISHSTAGENWLSNLISYLYEAMLSPPSYGGNPQGIGWQWLEHQAGFPLPKAGQRYFELPDNGFTVKKLAHHYRNKHSGTRKA